jgi:hypothetical protein
MPIDYVRGDGTCSPFFRFLACQEKMYAMGDS